MLTTEKPDQALEGFAFLAFVNEHLGILSFIRRE